MGNDNHAIFELVHSGGKKRASVTMPQDVVRVNDAHELQAQLQHYKKANGVTFLRHVVVDSTHARIQYVTRIRPALRYYCKKFKVPVPDWLKTDTAFETLSVQKQHELFGCVLKFPVREFAEINTSGTKREPGKEGNS